MKFKRLNHKDLDLDSDLDQNLDPDLDLDQDQAPDQDLNQAQKLAYWLIKVKPFKANTADKNLKLGCKTSPSH